MCFLSKYVAIGDTLDQYDGNYSQQWLSTFVDVNHVKLKKQ